MPLLAGASLRAALSTPLAGGTASVGLDGGWQRHTYDMVNTPPPTRLDPAPDMVIHRTLKRWAADAGAWQVVNARCDPGVIANDGSDATRLEVHVLGARPEQLSLRMNPDFWYPLIAPDRWINDFKEAGFRPQVHDLILKQNAIRALKIGSRT